MMKKLMLILMSLWIITGCSSMTTGDIVEGAGYKESLQTIEENEYTLHPTEYVEIDGKIIHFGGFIGENEVGWIINLGIQKGDEVNNYSYIVNKGSIIKFEEEIFLIVELNPSLNEIIMKWNHHEKN